MENKTTYSTPELEITSFKPCDIVTASFGSDNGFDGETDTDW